MWFPNGDVNHDVRVKGRDRFDGAVVLTWDDTMEDRTT